MVLRLPASEKLARAAQPPAKLAKAAKNPPAPLPRPRKVGEFRWYGFRNPCVEQASLQAIAGEREQELARYDTCCVFGVMWERRWKSFVFGVGELGILTFGGIVGDNGSGHQVCVCTIIHKETY
jgi:hypothetical protein